MRERRRWCAEGGHDPARHAVGERTRRTDVQQKPSHQGGAVMQMRTAPFPPPVIYVPGFHQPIEAIMADRHSSIIRRHRPTASELRRPARPGARRARRWACSEPRRRPGVRRGRNASGWPGKVAGHRRRPLRRRPDSSRRRRFGRRASIEVVAAHMPDFPRRGAKFELVVPLSEPPLLPTQGEDRGRFAAHHGARDDRP